MFKRSIDRRRLLALALFGSGLPGAAQAVAVPTPVVATAEGPVRGRVADGVARFLGIPYAAPPVGDLRWRPPAAPARRTAPLEATRFSAQCPQVTLMGSFAGPAGGDEDCLYLNIYADAAGGKGGDKGAGMRKPVLVWIHGGGNKNGSAADYDPVRLARGGPFGSGVVVVTINYRLGLLGYFSNPAINAEGHAWGNYGLLDQQAALRWIRANIAAFGGDPHNITISGQSSGAANAIAQMVSPQGEGLFDKVILQSGPPFEPDAVLPTQTGARALERGEAFARDAGCADAQCLRHLSVARILQLQGTPARNGPYVEEFFVDGTIIPASLTAAIEQGRYHHVPVLAGTTRDEGAFFLGIDEYASGKALEPAAYEAANQTILDRYPLSRFGGDPTAAQNAALTDMLVCSEMDGVDLLARQNGTAPVYAYEFTYRDAPYYFPKMPNAYDKSGNFRALAAHTIDIQFLFDGFHGGNLGVNLDQVTGMPRGLTPAERRLSDEMIGMWTNFARSGDPSLPGHLRWPAYTRANPVYLDQSPAPVVRGVADFRKSHDCAWWAHHKS